MKKRCMAAVTVAALLLTGCAVSEAEEESSTAEESTTSEETVADDQYIDQQTGSVVFGEVMEVDASKTVEENLETYFDEYLVPAFGLSSQEPVSVILTPSWEGDNASMSPADYLDIEGIITHVICDLDHDGTCEMLVPLFAGQDISGSDPAVYHSSRFFRLNLLLVSDCGGVVGVTGTETVVSDGTVYADLEQSGFNSTETGNREMRIYTVDRGDHTAILLVTELVNGGAFGDANSFASYMWEVSSGQMMPESSYVYRVLGSDGLWAVESEYENGELISEDTYYDYPEENGADPSMVNDPALYFDRMGLAATNEADEWQWPGYRVTDGDASMIAHMSVRTDRLPIDGSACYNYQMETP